MLSSGQLEFIAGILSDIGQVFFASMVAPVVISGLFTGFIWSGLILAFCCWTLGLLIIKLNKS